MTALKFTVVLALASYVLAGHVSNSTCPNTGLTTKCPSDKVAYCAGDSLKTNIIIRCSDTAGGVCPIAGNCNDNLAGVPPVGVKTDAKCYQDSEWAGNAQCVYNCVVATKLDGTKFYPVGCTSASSSVPTSSASSSTPPSSTHGHPETSSYPHHSHTKSYPTGGYPSGGPHSHLSHTGIWTNGTKTYHHTKTYTSTETTSSQSGVITTSSTTYYTTTLPGGSVSTGSSVVSYTTTTSGPVLSNNAVGQNAQGILGLALAGLIALV